MFQGGNDSDVAMTGFLVALPECYPVGTGIFFPSRPALSDARWVISPEWIFVVGRAMKIQGLRML